LRCLLRWDPSTGTGRALHQVSTSQLAERLKAIDQLSEEDRISLLHILDALLTKNKVKELAAGAG